MSTILNYCGGLSDVKKSGDMVVAAFPDYILLSGGMFSKKHKIPFDCITDVSLKSEEQITSDVTLSRLLLLGVFAFGAKKKRAHQTNCLVIEYIDNGISGNVIFTGKDVPKFYSELSKERQKYYKKHPDKMPSSHATVNSTSDPYSEIEKVHELLEKGLVTQEEFDAKKKQLLDL